MNGVKLSFLLFLKAKSNPGDKIIIDNIDKCLAVIQVVFAGDKIISPPLSINHIIYLYGVGQQDHHANAYRRPWFGLRCADDRSDSPLRNDTFEHTISGLLTKRADLFGEATKLRDRLAEIKNDVAASDHAPVIFFASARAEMGMHHRISGAYVGFYADEMAWREDHRRKSDGVQYLIATNAALTHPVSRQWKRYWQRSA